MLLLAAVVHFHFKAECKSSSAARLKSIEIGTHLDSRRRLPTYLRASVRMYVCTICTYVCMYVQYLIDVQYVRMYNMYVCMYVQYLIDEL